MQPFHVGRLRQLKKLSGGKRRGRNPALSYGTEAADRSCTTDAVTRRNHQNPARCVKTQAGAAVSRLHRVVREEQKAARCWTFWRSFYTLQRFQFVCCHPNLALKFFLFVRCKHTHGWQLLFPQVFTDRFIADLLTMWALSKDGFLFLASQKASIIDS